MRVFCSNAHALPSPSQAGCWLLAASQPTNCGSCGDGTATVTPTPAFPDAAGRKLAIFKPCDEEPLAPCNPKGYVGRCLGEPGWKPTVRVGEAALREVAAYLLDHERFAGEKRAPQPHCSLPIASPSCFFSAAHLPEVAAYLLDQERFAGERRASSLRACCSHVSFCSVNRTTLLIESGWLVMCTALHAAACLSAPRLVFTARRRAPHGAGPRPPPLLPLY